MSPKVLNPPESTDGILDVTLRMTVTEMNSSMQHVVRLRTAAYFSIQQLQSNTITYIELCLSLDEQKSVF